jgi:hypothetical protein
MSSGILMLQFKLVNLTIDFYGDSFYTQRMTSPEKNGFKNRYPDRLYPPPSIKEWLTWLSGSGAFIVFVMTLTWNLPDAKQQRALLSYTPTSTLRPGIPLSTPTPLPMGVTISIGRPGTATPTPDPRGYRPPVHHDRAFPGY